VLFDNSDRFAHHLLMSDENIKALLPAHFKRYCGVKPETFQQMCEVIRAELKRTQTKPGRPPKLTIEDQVLLTPESWREYPTRFHMAQRWGLSEPTVWRILTRVENILKRCADFRLPGKKRLHESDNPIDMIIVDATETPIERPKKQRQYYSGKKKQHTIKSQVIVNRQTREVIFTAQRPGKTHDFAVFKQMGSEIARGLHILVRAIISNFAYHPTRTTPP
jgi:hypothetical protein